MAGRQEPHKTSTDAQLQPAENYPSPIVTTSSEGPPRQASAFLGDFDGLDQHLFKEFKTAEC